MSSIPQVATQNCPKCGQPYEWKPEYVGKIAKCPCGYVMKVPRLPKGHRLPPIAQSAPPPSPAAIPSIPDAVNMNPFATLHKEDPLPEEVERELAALGAYREAAPSEFDKFRDVNLPTALLAVGLALALAQIAYMSRSGTLVLAATAVILVQLAVNLALMLGGVLLAARFAGIDFGPLHTALVKLCAASVAPTALGGFITQMLGGDIAVTFLGLGISVLCYWGLLSYLFRLDGAQTMVCVLAIAGVRLVAYMCILGTISLLVMKWLGAAGGCANSMPDMPLSGIGE